MELYKISGQRADVYHGRHWQFQSHINKDWIVNAHAGSKVPSEGDIKDM